jgi:hypothetical protein
LAACVLRTAQDEATAFEMGDQPLSNQSGHQLVRIMHPAATIMT